MPQPWQRQVLEFVRSLVKAEIRGTSTWLIDCKGLFAAGDGHRYLAPHKIDHHPRELVEKFIKQFSNVEFSRGVRDRR